MSSDLVNLEQVADVIDSLHKTPAYSRDGFPMVRVTDVKYGYLDLADCLRVPPETYEEFSRRYKPKINDIVITRVGSYGNTAIVKNPEFCLGQNTAAIIPKNINPRYLYAALNSPQVKAEIEAQIVGSTQKTLSLARIKGLNIPRHSPQVEEDIASTIGALDDRITLLRETNKTLESIAQAIFKSWFVDFDPVRAKMEGRQPEGIDEVTAALFPDSFEESELGLIPSTWKVGTLGDILALRNERAKPSELTKALPYVPIENISPKTPFLFDHQSGENAKSSLALFHENDILFGAMRPYFHKVCIAPFPGVTRTTVFTLFSRNPKTVFFSLLQAFQDTTVDYATQHSEGSTIPYAKWRNSLELMAITLPPTSLQEKFSKLTSSLIEKANSNVKHIKTLTTLRDSLLPRLISGQLRLPEAQEQIANALL